MCFSSNFEVLFHTCVFALLLLLLQFLMAFGIFVSTLVFFFLLPVPLLFLLRPLYFALFLHSMIFVIRIKMFIFVGLPFPHKIIDCLILFFILLYRLFVYYSISNSSTNFFNRSQVSDKQQTRVGGIYLLLVLLSKLVRNG